MFDVKSRGMKDIPYRFAWLGFFVGCTFVAGWAWPGLRHSIGPVLLALVGLVVYTAFWWFSLWVLLLGRIHWRYLIPAAVATAVCWVGMHVVFSLIFSGQVTSDYKEYGAVGVVFALMSYFIAIGVVIILGAAAGIVWRERELSFARAYRHLRRRRAQPTGRLSR
jgi:membrane protein